MPDGKAARGVAFDTTSAHGSLALIDGGAVIAERAIDGPDGYSPVVFDEFLALLASAGWPLESIDYFAGASGPGSFTGVRVCLTAAKGLAESLARPAFGVSNLQAAAMLAMGDLRAVWLDARRGQIYAALYHPDLTLAAGEVVSKPDAWRATLPVEAVVSCADGWRLAGAIARIAAARYAGGERPDPAALDANYVRRADAELAWRDG